MPNRNPRQADLYTAIKAEICSGQLLPGHRVDMAGLGNRYSASPSPVRNVLNRLVGEGLLEVHPNDGFYRPVVTEQVVREQYSWNRSIMLLALDSADTAPVQKPLPPLTITTEDAVAAIEQVFTAVAGLSDSRKTVDEMVASNDQLRALRRQKPATLFDRSGEVSAFTAAWSSGDITALRQEVLAYHDRRLAHISQIVAYAYQPTSGH
ncbi:GntR family transcriptional regulator [Asticcacaulis sp.]|uniref:GntR family transcriptional regulator n=1 Tax=Asticcacaulis sp. TaxID=1872648 RepID=UPI002C18AC5D|nr:GntR family transcriptional regulator [Asticcacaulis sp.]HTM81569.1 GntR family transcriptional regulator [Asticcacaulis sp.]